MTEVLDLLNNTSTRTTASTTVTETGRPGSPLVWTSCSGDRARRQGRASDSRLSGNADEVAHQRRVVTVNPGKVKLTNPAANRGARRTLRRNFRSGRPGGGQESSADPVGMVGLIVRSWVLRDRGSHGCGPFPATVVTGRNADAAAPSIAGGGRPGATGPATARRL